MAKKTLIHAVYNSVASTELFDRVIEATDNQKIYDSVKSFGGEVQMTNVENRTGTDRVAEVASGFDYEVIANIQGDEPFIKKDAYKVLLNSIKNGGGVSVATLAHKFKNRNSVEDINKVKVLLDKENNAIYFSRSIIPFDRDKNSPFFYLKHIGVYIYKRDALLKFATLKSPFIERSEKLEQLRFLFNNIDIRVEIVPYNGIGIDTKEDLIKANAILDL